MQALSLEGKEMVEFHQRELYRKSNLIINQPEHIEQLSSLDQVKEQVIRIRDIAFSACHNAYHVGVGLTVHVMNEEVDTYNWHILNAVSESLYSLYCDCFKSRSPASIKSELRLIVDQLKKLNLH